MYIKTMYFKELSGSDVCTRGNKGLDRASLCGVGDHVGCVPHIEQAAAAFY
jgi:hypothetical protein